MDDQMYITIAKVLGGEASPAEHRALEEWLAADAGNKAILADLEIAWKEADVLLSAPEFNTEVAWDKVSVRMRPAVSPVAAPETPAAPPGSRTIAFPAWIKYSIGVAAVLLIAFLVFRPTGTDMVQIAAADGNKTVTLPDGSVITLREGSNLSYPRQFAQNTRNVSLDGEAFFEVARNEAQPFVIDARSVDVRVLGTSFNVRCSESAADVAVTTGKVQVTSQANEKMQAVLVPGKAAHYADNLLTTGDAEGYEAIWKNDTLDFRAAPMAKVIGAIASVKKVSISTDRLTPALLNQAVTIRLRRAQSVEDMLTELCLISQTRWERNGSGYLIRAK